MSSVQSKFLTLAICASCFFPRFLSAQDFRPAYIVTLKGDSIKGFASYKSGKKSASYCVFKTTKKGTTTRYTPDDLLAYGFNGDKAYLASTLPEDASGGKIFLRILAAGPISLYRHGKIYYIKKESLQALPAPKDKQPVTKDGLIMTQEDRRYVDMLNTMINDCGMAADQMKYADDDLTTLINNYNRCKGQGPLYTRPRSGLHVGVNVFGSVIQSNMNMDWVSTEHVTFDPARTIAGGLGFDISSPRLFDRVALSLEGWYVKTFYQAYTEFPFTGGMTHKDIYMDITYIKSTVGIRYSFRQGDSSPYIKAGFLTGFLQSTKVRSQEDKEIFNDKTITVSREVEGGYQMRRPKGLWGAVGYSKKLSGRLGAFAEFRYENSEGFVGTAIVSNSRMNNYNLTLGISF